MYNIEREIEKQQRINIEKAGQAISPINALGHWAAVSTHKLKPPGNVIVWNLTSTSQRQH